MIEVPAEKIKCKLLVEELIESKAKRVFHIFKPKEVVANEKYRLGLTFTNTGDTMFNGGEIQAQVAYPVGGRELQFDLTESIPMMSPKQSKAIKFGTQTAMTSGIAVLRVMSIVLRDKNVEIECRSVLGEDLLDRRRDNVLNFSVASREEIYQRYSVVVAIFFSTIAIILSIINAIASIIALLR